MPTVPVFGELVVGINYRILKREADNQGKLIWGRRKIHETVPQERSKIETPPLSDGTATPNA